MFADRQDAGRRLAGILGQYAGRPDVLVLALPRGGVPVAAEIARALGVPLDLFLVRKLGVPGHEEYAMGAIASGGARVLNRAAVQALGIPDDVIEEVAAREREELIRREQAYRGGRPAPLVKGRNVILVDDGLATGASMHVAVTALRKQEPARVIVAVPVASRKACEGMQGIADEVVCLETPEDFEAVGQWYGDFSQVDDREVADLLQEGWS